MTRTVKVELEADVAGYIGGVAEADKATGKLDNKVEDLDHDLDKLGKNAVETAAELGVLGGTAKEVGTELDDVGKKTEETSKKTTQASESTKSLRVQMDDLEESLKKTGTEMSRNSDPELLKKFKTDSSELTGLKSTVKQMEQLGLNVKALGLESEKAGGLFESLQTGAEGGLGSPIALGLAGIAAGPALAAAGGLVTGALGAAGAGVGVASAVMGNPKAFQAAWQDATAHVQKDFLDIGAAFTGPTLDAIKTIGPTVDGWHLADALAPAAKYVPMIAKGLEGAATGLEHGLADVIAKAGPDVQVLSQGLTQLGVAGGDALSHIADGAEGGAQALHDVLTVTSAIVEGFGYVTEAAEKSFGFLSNAASQHPITSAIATGGLSLGASAWATMLGSADDSGKAFSKTLEGVALNGNLAADAAAAAAPDFTALSTALNATKVDGDSLAETMSTKVLNTFMSLDQAALGFNEALLTVDDSVKKNGHSLSDHTTQGLANQQMMLGLVQANIQSYQANVAAGMGAEEAAAAYDDGTAAIEKQLRAAGFNQAAIEGMIGKYKQVPKNIDTTIALNGLTDAINNLGDLIAKLNHIDGHNYHSTVTTDYIDNRKSTTSSQVPSYSNSTPVHDPHPHAAGGMLDPGWNLLGEQGPELEYNGRVFTAPQTRSMMSTPGRFGGSGGGAVTVTVGTAAGGDLTPLGSLINKMIRDGLIVVKASQVRANS